MDPLEILLHQLGWASGAAEPLGAWSQSLRRSTVPTTQGLQCPTSWSGCGARRGTELLDWQKMAIDAGLAEKQVRLAERQGQIIAQIFTTVLDDDTLGLSHEQRDAGRSLAARQLRALEV